MLRALGREREAGEREEAVPQQLLVRPLTEKRTRNSLGFSFPFFFFVSSPSWTADAGLKHAPSSPSPRFKGLQLPLQPPQQQQSLGVRKSLPSSPQRFCVSMPSGNGSEFSQSTYRKSRRLQLRGTEFSGLLEQVGVWMYAYGWLRGPGATAPVTGPCE